MTVQQYQHLYNLQQTIPDDVIRLGKSICYLYNLNPEKVNLWSPRKFLRVCKRLDRSLNVKPAKIQIVKFYTDATKINFGQFIECQQWLKSDPVDMMHMVAASILRSRGNHKADAERMLTANVNQVFHPVQNFIESLKVLIENYKNLFAGDKEDPDQIKKKAHPFIANFGWQFSASQVALHLAIPVNDAFEISVIEALNILVYLKEKGKYDSWLSKQVV